MMEILGSKEKACELAQAAFDGTCPCFYLLLPLPFLSLILLPLPPAPSVPSVAYCTHTFSFLIVLSF
jgi:hypothetical protein